MTTLSTAKPALSVLFAACLVALPTTAQSDTELRASTYVQTIGTDGLGNREEKEAWEALRSPDTAGIQTDLLTSSSNISGAFFSAGGPVGATAVATYGYMIVEVTIGGAGSQAFAGVLTDSFFGGHETDAGTRFEDDVIIDAPGLTGTQGTATFHYTHDAYALLDGFIQPDGLPSTFNKPELSVTVEMTVRVANYREDFSTSRSLTPAGDITLDEMPDEVVAENFTFTYGTPFKIRAKLDATAYLEASGFQLAQGRVSGGFPTGFQWLGITGLPANATVTGAIDWSKAAPSPFTGEDPDPGPILGPPGGSGATGGGGSGGSLNGWLTVAILTLFALRRRTSKNSLLPAALSHASPAFQQKPKGSR
ncbi:MAG: GlyGly-CTERM sorting domain-containing protein [Saccharospirillum sp.]|nr:GlyGly-CTERM sorting domain-containing protein [Saccharospirillum sp.]